MCFKRYYKLPVRALSLQHSLVIAADPNLLKLILPPSSAILHTSARPPTSMQPLMATASNPDIIMSSWAVSAHKTAFIPPCNETLCCKTSLFLLFFFFLPFFQL